MMEQTVTLSRKQLERLEIEVKLSNQQQAERNEYMGYLTKLLRGKNIEYTSFGEWSAIRKGELVNGNDNNG